LRHSPHLTPYPYTTLFRTEAFRATPQNIRPRPALPLTPLAGQDVVIVSAWPGAPRLLVDSAVASGANGIIIEALGSGNMGSAMGDRKCTRLNSCYVSISIV